MRAKSKITAQYTKKINRYKGAIILLLSIPTILLAIRPFLAFKTVQLFYDDNWLQDSPNQVRKHLTKFEYENIYTCIKKTTASYNFFGKIQDIKQNIVTNCFNIPHLKLYVDKSLPLKLSIKVPKIKIVFYIVIKDKDLTGIVINQQNDLYPIVVKSPPSKDMLELAKQRNIPVVYYEVINSNNLSILDKVFTIHKSLRLLPEFTPSQYTVVQTVDAPPTLIIHFKQFKLYLNPHLTNKAIVNKINQAIEIYKRLKRQTQIEIIDTRFDRITIK